MLFKDNTQRKKENQTIKRKEYENEQRKIMKNALSVAEDILNEYGSKIHETHPIYMYIKELVNKELYQNIYNVVTTHDESKVKYYGMGDLLPPPDNWDDNLYKTEYKTVKYYDFIDDCKLEFEKPVNIELGIDAVITRPWNIYRHISAFQYGTRTNFKKWEQDSNHRIFLVMPYGISFVESGNHSITSGILNCEGIVEAEYIYDFSDIYNYIECDGVNYFRKYDNSYYASVTNLTFSIIFEIGRLIQKRKFSTSRINYKNKPVSMFGHYVNIGSINDIK